MMELVTSNSDSTGLNYIGGMVNDSIHQTIYAPSFLHNNTIGKYRFNLTEIYLNLSSNCDVSDNGLLNNSYFKCVIYVMYSAIFLIALLGNGIVCYIVITSPRMRTVTNFFIANLAIGDLMMSIFCIPFSFVSILWLHYWPFGIVLCKIVNFSQAVSVLISAYTLVAISVDRYIAIIWPLRPRITKRYAKFIIVVIWAIALSTALPIPIISQVDIPHDSQWHTECDKGICHEAWPTAEDEQYYSFTLLGLQFLIPLTVLVFTYTCIAIAVWGKRPPGEAENSRDQRMHKSKRKMIKMMVTVVIVFITCWLPFNVFNLINKEIIMNWSLTPYIWFSVHWLAMSHSCYNPIIYCYMNARFRIGFMQVIQQIPCIRRFRCVQRYLGGHGSSIGTGLAFTGTDETYHLHRTNTLLTSVQNTCRQKAKSRITPV